MFESEGVLYLNKYIISLQAEACTADWLFLRNNNIIVVCYLFFFVYLFLVVVVVIVFLMLRSMW